MSKLTRFNDDFMEKLRNPEFASNYIMSAIVDNDIDFLPIALGDVAKAHGMSKLAEGTGINRRTLYKVFDKNSNPSFDLVTQIIDQLGLSIEVKPKKAKRKKTAYG
jgi:probable addiction module antidote protein